MVEQYAGALLYLVPVLVAAVVAFIVTRPEKDEEPSPVVDSLPPRPISSVSRPRIPGQRTYQPLNRRANPSTVAPSPSPTLLHAALSSHLAAVASASSSAPSSSSIPAVRPARLVSIRRPARIPRRAIHRCPHKP
ncbi:hypothetical protein ACQP00_44925 [Dactylosporangium sp. CS-047395]|uniref:hypothetical protein n=1 Tax=Dactylosporangium sp. CS-047395 TaxID=3239936 RepID=UPI003D8D7388